MAVRALLDLHFEGVRVVAVDAGLVAIDMGEHGIVAVAVVLVAALGQGAVLGNRSCIVVDVAEAQVGADRIGIHPCCFDRGIHTDLGLAALVAFHAARLVTQMIEDQPGGHDHTLLDDGRVVVAGDAVNDGARCNCGVDCILCAAVNAQVILVTGAAVALSALDGDFLWIILVPVAESFSRCIGMSRPLPLFEERYDQWRRLGVAAFLRSRCSLRCAERNKNDAQHDDHTG